MRLINEHYFWTGLFAGVAAAMLLAVSLTACGSPNQNTNRATHRPAASVPTIHGRQTLVLLTDGHSQVAQTYHRHLRLCRQTPTPTRALDKTVEAKLGRIYYEFWIDDNRAAAIANIWSFRQGEGQDVCNFYPVHNVRRVVSGPNGTYRINVNDSTATYVPDASYHRPPPRASGSIPAQDSHQSPQRQRQRVAEMLRKHGFGKIAKVVQKPPGHITTTIAGQPAICTTSKFTQSRQCIWSGGRQWGFYGHARDAYLGSKGVPLQNPGPLMAPAANIMLSRRPTDGNGMRMTTQTFTIGGPVPAHVFSVPNDLSVQTWKPRP